MFSTKPDGHRVSCHVRGHYPSLFLGQRHGKLSSERVMSQSWWCLTCQEKQPSWAAPSPGQDPLRMQPSHWFPKESPQRAWQRTVRSASGNLGWSQESFEHGQRVSGMRRDLFAHRDDLQGVSLSCTSSCPDLRPSQASRAMKLRLSANLTA